MLKKRKYYYEQQLLLRQYTQQEFFRLILRSIFKNQEVSPIIRHSLSPQLQVSTFYKTRFKLRCCVTLSKRVPNHKLLLSRYYLTKFVDNVYLSGITRY